MVRCPKCGGFLEKTMERAVKVEGVWFPGFRCSKCGATYSHEELFPKKFKREVEKYKWQREETEEVLERVMRKLLAEKEEKNDK